MPKPPTDAPRELEDHKNSESLYKAIGLPFIDAAITEFYKRAFVDPLIGHFFFQKDRLALTAKQITFAARMLGSTELRYEGLPLKQAHSELPLTLTHFRRRQVLMANVLEDLGLPEPLAKQWLLLEEGLRKLIINSDKNCRA